jgi:hypothetical protein
MTDGDVGFGHAVDTVFRTEKFDEIDSRSAGEHVDRTLTESVDPSPVRHEAAAQALEAGEPFGREDIDTEHDLPGGWRDRSRCDGRRTGVATATSAAGTAGESNGAQRTQGGEVKKLAAIHGVQ